MGLEHNSESKSFSYFEVDFKNPTDKDAFTNLIEKWGYSIEECGWRIIGRRAFYYLNDVLDGDELLRNLKTQIEENNIEDLFPRDRILYFKKRGYPSATYVL